MSTLIKIDPEIQSDPEQDSHESCYFVFDTLHNISAVPKEEVAVNMVDNAILMQGTNLDIDVSRSIKMTQKGGFL